jgi:hypothetical protein
MDRQVAIKVPSHRLLATERAREEFLREARSVARLQHERIVRAYDFGHEVDGRCYIVYEFIDGASLAERIKPERTAADPLPPEEATRIVAQVAEALHYAHLQGLVHRDIKPANILLDRAGRPKVADFGLAVREEELAGERGRLAGTLRYMSPEQVRRESHHIDGRTDIYSLGVVLYELLCGRRPFTAVTEDELIDQILHREAKPPRQISDSIPRQLERVCLKALAKRIQDRYTTAKDMAQEVLRAIESSESSEPGPDTAITLPEITTSPEGRMEACGYAGGMLETVTPILSILEKAIKMLDLAEWRRKDRLNALGTELFLIYVNLNEVLACGTEIVDGLEVYLKRMQHHIDTGKDSYALTGGSWIAYKLQVQRVNLARVGHSIQRFGSELQVLDATTYRQLLPFIAGKFNALNALVEILESGKLPISGPEGAGNIDLDQDDYEAQDLLWQAMARNTIDTSQSWDSTIFERIKDYFDTRNPRKHLAKLEQILRTFKQTLEGSFSVKDVLVDIGDKRLRNYYDGHIF